MEILTYALTAGFGVLLKIVYDYIVEAKDKERALGHVLTELRNLERHYRISAILSPQNFDTSPAALMRLKMCSYLRDGPAFLEYRELRLLSANSQEKVLESLMMARNNDFHVDQGIEYFERGDQENFKFIGERLIKRMEKQGKVIGSYRDEIARELDLHTTWGHLVARLRRQNS